MSVKDKYAFSKNEAIFCRKTMSEKAVKKLKEIQLKKIHVVFPDKLV